MSLGRNCANSWWDRGAMRSAPPRLSQPDRPLGRFSQHSGLTHFGTLYIFTRAAHRGLSVYWSRALLVCNAQFYTIPIVQAIEQECIAHRQCAVTQNNERFCRGGLRWRSDHNRWPELSGRLNISMNIPVVSRATIITNTLHCVTMSSHARSKKMIKFGHI